MDTPIAQKCRLKTGNMSLLGSNILKIVWFKAFELVRIRGDLKLCLIFRRFNFPSPIHFVIFWDGNITAIDEHRRDSDPETAEK